MTNDEGQMTKELRNSNCDGEQHLHRIAFSGFGIRNSFGFRISDFGFLPVTVLPTIERELRAAGRQAHTYYLRLLGAVALIVSIVLFVMDHGLEANSGGALFARLHVILFWSIWI